MRARAVRVVGVVVAASFVVASLAGASSFVAHSGGRPSGLIAFTRAGGIYVIRADGRGERPLRRGSVVAGVGALAWSPDGRKIAFATSGGIWVMNANGSHPVRLVAAGQIGARAFLPSLSWSPLSGRIAFVAFGEKEPDIWVVNADGTNAHRLLRTPHHSEFQVDWSPYDDRIAVADPRGYFFHVYLMNTNGKHVRTINPGWMFQAAMPHWSPNGQWIAYIAWPGSVAVQEAEIWVTHASGRNPQRLTHNSVIDSDPSWSSSGGQVVFVRGCSEKTIWVSPDKRSPAEIYVMNADGTGVKRLTHNGVGEGSPAWQPVPSP